MATTTDATPKAGEEAWREVIVAASRATESAREAYDDNRLIRDRRISEAIGAGISRPRVAGWAKVSKIRVTQICADPFDDEV